MKGCMRAFGVVLASLTLSVFAVAQTLFDNFESYDLDGEPISGTGDWYNPSPDFSVDWNLYLYANASLITQRNPNGGDKVLVGYKPEGTKFARVQKNFDWSQRDWWLVSYDVFVNYFRPSEGPGRNYNHDFIGSFSIQPVDGAQYFIDLFRWKTPAGNRDSDGNFVEGNPQNGWYMAWTVANNNNLSALTYATISNSPFNQLQIRKWYRRFVAFTFNGTDYSGESASFLVKVGIRDLETGETRVALVGPTADQPTWYLVRPNNTSDRPTAFRFFVGGLSDEDSYGNFLAVDNLLITGFSYGDVTMDGCVDDADLLAVLFAFGSTDSFLAEDTNGDGTVDDADLLTVLFAFGEGC